MKQDFLFTRLLLLLLLLLLLACLPVRAGIGLGGGPVNVTGTTNVFYATNNYSINIPGFQLTLGAAQNTNAVFIGSLTATIVNTNLASFTNSYATGTNNTVNTNFPSVNLTVQVISGYSANTGTNTIPVQAN